MFLRGKSWMLWRRYIVIWVSLAVLVRWTLPISTGAVVRNIWPIIVSGVMGILLLRSTSSVLILAISNAFHDATSERYYYYDAVQEARLQREHGGYYVVANITETYGIDCFDNASRLQCFASMVNSPYKGYNVVRKITPRANVQKSIATYSKWEKYFWSRCGSWYPGFYWDPGQLWTCIYIPYLSGVGDCIYLDFERFGWDSKVAWLPFSPAFLVFSPLSEALLRFSGS